MTFDEYQQKAITTDTYEAQMNSIMDPAFLEKMFGLVGEAGEVAEKMKKIIRDKNGIMNDEDKKEIIKEFGDVLWYVSGCAYYLGVPLEQVAARNLEKVLSRKSRGKTHGSGDNR